MLARIKSMKANFHDMYMELDNAKNDAMRLLPNAEYERFMLHVEVINNARQVIETQLEYLRWEVRQYENSVAAELHN